MDPSMITTTVLDAGEGGDLKKHLWIAQLVRNTGHLVLGDVHFAHVTGSQ